MYYKIENGGEVVFQVCADFAATEKGADAINTLLRLVDCGGPALLPASVTSAIPEVVVANPLKKRPVKPHPEKTTQAADNHTDAASAGDEAGHQDGSAVVPPEPRVGAEVVALAKPDLPPAQITDRDLNSYCVSVLQKIGGETPANELREFAAGFVPEGQVPSPSRILLERRQEFIDACTTKWGVAYHG